MVLIFKIILFLISYFLMLGRYFLYVNVVFVSFYKGVIVIYYNILHYFGVFVIYR